MQIKSELLAVPIRGREVLGLLTAKAEKYVPLKPVVEALGLDWSAQYRRVQRCPVLSKGVAMMATTGGDGKQYKMQCLPLGRTGFFLAGLDTSRIVDVEKRELVIAFQEECAELIDAALSGLLHERESWLGVRQVAKDHSREMNANLQLSRRMIGKDTQHHHYANESRMVNRVCFDMDVVVRDELSALQIQLLDASMQMNAGLLLAGMAYGDRKERLHAFVARWWSYRSVAQDAASGGLIHGDSACDRH
ncbi:phage antirepressor N-terminal domain-containing protein [Chromobacterium vaccinii]|uniref:phage antirepressor N-terminal domain-containing protein n=1 Tax=Chromobacterium vaccinii TaxID=1108595 RepID=UPI0031D068C5